MITIKYCTSYHGMERERTANCFYYMEDTLSPKEQVETMLRFSRAWSHLRISAKLGAVLTMSEHVINGLRLAVKRKIIDPRALTIEFCPDDGEKQMISIDNNGSLSSYPDGFMDTWNDVLMELAK